MSFIELERLTGQSYHVCIDHISHVYTDVYNEQEHTVVSMNNGQLLRVLDSPYAIVKQIHFLKKDTWTEVKHQTVVDLIKEYGFEEGNRRYVEGAEKKRMEGWHLAGEARSKISATT